MKLEIWFGNEKEYYDRAIALGAEWKTAKYICHLLADPFSGYDQDIDWFMNPENDADVKSWLGVSK